MCIEYFPNRITNTRTTNPFYHDCRLRLNHGSFQAPRAAFSSILVPDNIAVQSKSLPQDCLWMSVKNPVKIVSFPYLRVWI
jgi:hypothetical protein